MTETDDKSKTSRAPQIERLAFTTDHEIQAFRELNPREAKKRALAALSCLHTGLPDLARLVLALGVNPGKAIASERGIIASPYGVPGTADHSRVGPETGVRA